MYRKESKVSLTLAANQKKKEKSYWLNQLSGHPVKSLFPFEFELADNGPYRLETINFAIPEKTHRRLIDISKGSNERLFIVLLTGIFILLRKYSGITDILIGIPVSRPREHTELLNSALVIRCSLKDTDSFRQLLSRIRQILIEAVNHQNFPIEILADLLELTWSPGQGFPLFDVMVSLKNIHRDTLNEFSPNIIVSFERTHQGIEGRIGFNTGRYGHDTAARLVVHYQELLKGGLANPDKEISAIELLSGEEKQEILVSFNDTTADFPAAIGVHELVDRQAGLTPHLDAVIYKDQRLSYGEFKKQSDVVAAELRTKGMGPDSIVAVLLDHSPGMVVTLIAILKAGCAYLPIDPGIPEERIRYITRDSCTKYIITTENYLEKIPGLQDKILLYSQLAGNSLPLEPVSKDKFHHQPRHLAYIMYTSGSTGKPKGVMIQHRSFIDFITWAVKVFEHRQGYQVLLSNSYASDGSIQQIFPPLVSGGTLHLIDKELRLDITRYLDYLKKNRINNIDEVPVLMNELVGQIEAEGLEEALPDLTCLCLGSEYVSVELARKCRKHINRRGRIINAYGPAEASVETTFYYFDGISEREISLIGKPRSNTRVYILDEAGNCCPIGVKGEICISGTGLARGYLNRPELTHEKFLIIEDSQKLLLGVQAPWQWEPKKASSFAPYAVPPTSNTMPSPHGRQRYKIYKTGDQGCWLPDGNIRFLGRIDNQIQVRGYRVELSEIQQVLKNHDGVKDAVVVTWKNKRGETEICAYYVKKTPDNGLRQYLQDRLPSYMVPSHLVELAEIPLTPNGKVNKEALPKPGTLAKQGYVPPRDILEKKLVTLWSEVLSLPPSGIGIDDDFFHSGGHSLRATVLVSRIYRDFNVQIPLGEIFKTSHIRGLARYIKQSSQSEVEKYISIEPTEEKDYYPLSSAQLRLYILQQFEGGDHIAYNIPSVFEWQGEFSREKLEQIIGNLINRHESLRTFFEMVNDQPLQRVHRGGLPDFEIEDFSAVGEDSEGEIVKKIIRDFIRPFDLSKAPLLRVGVIKMTEVKHIIMLDMHHIISDGISSTVLEEEFAALYEGRELQAQGIQYKDYVAWQDKEKEKGKIKKQEEYWQKEFTGDIPFLDLPTDYKRPLEQGFEGKWFFFTLPGEDSAALETLALAEGVTHHTMILTIYYILLHKLSGQEDIVIGVPTAGRLHADVQRVIGVFLNTLAVRSFPRGKETFKKFLKQIKTKVIKAFENQEYQFEDLVDKLRVKRDTGRNPLFDVMFLLQNYEVKKLQIPGLKLKPVNFETHTSKFDISLYTMETKHRLSFALHSSTKLFKRETIEIIIQQFKTIFTSVLKNPDQEILAIDVMSEESKRTILGHLNRNLWEEARSIIPPGQTFQDKIEENFTRFKNNRAVEYNDKVVTYGELDRQSDYIAAGLVKHGGRKETFIGILLDDRLKLIAAILGIIKAGCVFVPLEPTYPAGRLELMIRHSQIGIVISDEISLTHSALENTLREQQVTILSTRDLYSPGTMAQSAKKPVIRYQPEDKIYIYFTSGTTGTPKAIIGKNSGLLHFINWEIERFEIEEGSRFSQFIIPCFDPYLRDIFVPLCSGGVIFIPGSKDIMLNPPDLVNWIEKTGIHLIHCVPSLFQLITSASLTGDNFKNLEYILLAGEKVTPTQLRGWYDIFDERIQLVNLYGPTETTLAKIHYLIRKDDINRARIPIGQPINGASVIILDEKLNMCGTLVKGEICIRTPFRSYGYYNDSSLTGQKFIQNPLSNDPGDILYKTGDSGKFLADGNIDILGRMDRQVKIRGQRIELEEIESLLLRHPAVNEAIVIKKEVSTRSEVLCAYIIENPDSTGKGMEETVLMEDLKGYLSGHLPGFMIPATITKLRQIPRNPNGKVDYKKLPDPVAREGTISILPSNTVEKKLLEMWSRILKIEEAKININTAFFELGGNSLNIMKLISGIHKVFDVKISMREIFTNPTIKKQATIIMGSKKDKFASLEAVEKKEYYELTSAQERLYIIYQAVPTTIAYNIHSILEVEGSLDRERLVGIFSQMVQRHESFRTSFENICDQMVQRIHEKVEFRIEYYNVEARALEMKTVIEDFVRPFHLSCPPLLRVGLIKYEDEKHILMVDMHHIIADMISLSILILDFMSLYKGDVLSALKLQYKDISGWQKKALKLGYMEKQREYWLNRFKGEIPVLNIPTNYPRPPVQRFEGADLMFTIDKQLTAKANQMAVKNDITLYTVLLAVCTVLLSKYSGQTDIIIGTPIAGRRHLELDNIVGMFVNVLLMRNKANPEQPFHRFLMEVKHNVVRAFENQDYQFDQLVEELDLKRDRSRNMLYDVIFTSETMEKLDFQIPGLKFKPYGNQLDRVGTSKTDLRIGIREIDGKILLRLTYASALFTRETAEGMGRHYMDILNQVMENHQIKLKDIKISHDLVFLKSSTLRDDNGGFDF